MTGQNGHCCSNYGDGRSSHRLSRRVDNGMGNDETEDGMAWANVQANQLLLSTCFLCGWDTMSLTVKVYWGGVTWINKLRC